MKKKLISMLTAVAMLAAPCSAFAGEIIDADIKIPDSVNTNLTVAGVANTDIAQTEIHVDNDGFYTSDKVSLYSDESTEFDVTQDAVYIDAIEKIHSTEFEELVIEMLENIDESLTLAASPDNELSTDNKMLIPMYNPYLYTEGYDLYDAENAENYLAVNAAIQEELGNTYYNILYTHPAIMYAQTGYNYSMAGITTNTEWYITIFTPMYIEEITDDESIALFNDWCQAIINKLITDDMDDIDKALVLHDYLAKTDAYDNESADGTAEELEIEETHTAYGAIVLKTAVCQGYALAYAHLLEMVGVESVIVTSEAMEHAWNLVKIGDNWYHVDVTYDDPLNSLYEDAGHINHDEFLRSDTSISTSTEDDPFIGVNEAHYDWVTYDNIVCDDTTYDDNQVDEDGNAPSIENQNAHIEWDGIYAFRRTSLEMKYKGDGKYLYIQAPYANIFIESYIDGTGFGCIVVDADDTEGLAAQEYYQIDTEVTLEDAYATPEPSEEPTATPTVEPTVAPFEAVINTAEAGTGAGIKLALSDNGALYTQLDMTYQIQSTDVLTLMYYEALNENVSVTAQLSEDKKSIDIAVSYSGEAAAISDIARLYISGNTDYLKTVYATQYTYVSLTSLAAAAELNGETIALTEEDFDSETEEIDIKYFYTSSSLPIVVVKTLEVSEAGEITATCYFVAPNDLREQIAADPDRYNMFVTKYDENGTFIGTVFAALNATSTNTTNSVGYRFYSSDFENGQSCKAMFLQDKITPFAEVQAFNFADIN